MKFKFRPLRRRQSLSLEGASFSVDRLWSEQSGEPREISHMIDRSYAYQSLRELRWHLADRFGIIPTDVDLQRI